MLYHLLYPLSQSVSAFNVFRYITFRSMVAFVVATLLCIFWGKAFIKFMRKKQFGQVVRDDGPSSHLQKAGTPTMGGVFIIASILATTFVCGNFLSLPLLATLFVMLSFFGLGFLDDYLKVLKKNTDGVSAKGKLLWQVSTSVIVSYALIHFDVINTEIYLPFFKDGLIDIGWFYIVFSSLVIVGSSNAVNLTDGLDGLAIGPIITSSATMALLTYIAGHKEISAYLFIPYIENIGELAVFASAIIGAGVGFLWYNSYPAQIFMGDAGSLSLGGVLGTIAVISKNEFLFVVIGGVFVVETVSVILQVGSFKLRKKRVFKMAPIHHHFELSGWSEPKVIVRFWIISIVLALISIATIKMR